jgi:hypothetical protein
VTKRERQLRYQLLIQQLEVICLYWDEFEERLGVEGLQNYIDAILDEMIKLREALKS